MNRHRQAEELSARVREELPRVAVQWLAALRRPLEELTRAALAHDLPDAAFRALVEEFSRRLPSLMEELDHDALAAPMEEAMGAAMANGIAARLTPARQAKSPWSRATYEAGRGNRRGKRCGDSWIPAWKKCNLSAGSVEDILAHIREGRPGNYTAVGKPLSAKAYGMVKKHATALRRSARPTASADDIRHALKNHAMELTTRDWATVLAGPQPGDTIRPSRTEGGAAAIEVWTPRGPSGHLLKVYRVTRARLAFHTMKHSKEN